MTGYWCEHAWLPGGPERSVAIDVDSDRITGVRVGAQRAGTVLPGLVLPGFVNAHSHAFHRALRGRTHANGGSFWTWRTEMYRVAERLDPDSYYRLARGVYAEMVLAGYTSVDEFHYLHHAPGGAGYDDPNAMSHALIAAATDAGIRITLLDTCYLMAGLAGEELDPVQRRFSDTDAESWAARAAAFRPEHRHAQVGAAVHSVRAVPRAQIPVVADWARERGAPLHAHVSEQRAENEACLAAYGTTPVAALVAALGERFVAVHATHLTPRDVRQLGAAGARACLCPTTERDLGDGIGPARELVDAGARLALGSDSHAVIDPFEELRGLEMDQRLAAEARGRFRPAELVAAGTNGATLGPGEPANLVVVDTGTVRTAGSRPVGIPLCATSADVRDVMVGGEWVVRDRAHVRVGDPARELATEIGTLFA